MLPDISDSLNARAILRAWCLLLLLLCASAALLVLPQKAHAAIPTNGLVHWWNFDGNGNDSVGSNNATLVGGVTFATGKSGQAAVFNIDGSTYATLGSNVSANLASANSIFLWVKMNNTNEGAQPFGAQTPFNFDDGTNQVRMSADDGGGPHLQIGNSVTQTGSDFAVYESNTWVHVGYVFNGSTFTLYKNGVPTPDECCGFGPTTGNTMGSMAPGDRSFGGSLDDVLIYNRAITQAEVSQIYTSYGTDTHGLTRSDLGGFSGETAGTAAFSTSSFTPPDNSLLVVVFTAFDGSSQSGLNAAMTLSGGGLTWTKRVGGWAATNFGAIQIWTATATSGPVSLIGDAGSNTVGEWHMHAFAYTGYDRASPIGAVASPIADGSAGGGPFITHRLSSEPAATSQVLASFFADELGDYTVGSGWTDRFLTQTTNISQNTEVIHGWTSRILRWEDFSANFETAAVGIEIKGARKTLSRPPNNLGLVGYWSFNEGTSTQATDFSGNGNTGTLTNNPTWISGKRGKGLGLAGATDNVTMSNSSTLAPSSISFGGWVKFNDLTTADQFILSRINGGGGYRMSFDNVDSECTADALCVWINEDGDRPLSYAGSNLTVGTWYHVMATYDGVSVFTLYVNGTAVASDSGLSGTIDYTDSAFCLGNSAGSPSTCDQSATNFSGSIDEFRVYNRALSATEVAKLYGGGAVKFTTSSVNLQQGSTLADGLVGLWTFDGGDTNWISANTGVVYDRSGNNNTGTLTNMSQHGSPAIGKLGQALVLDASNDTVTVADHSSIDLASSDATFTFWLKKPSLGAFEGIFWKRNGSNIQYGLEADDDELSFYIDGNVASNIVECTNCNLVAEQWQFVAVTFSDSGDNVDFYIDGNVKNDDGSISVSIPDEAHSLIFGEGNADEECNCTLDDVRIYNRALSPAEVAQLYKLGTVIIRP